MNRACVFVVAISGIAWCYGSVCAEPNHPVVEWTGRFDGKTWEQAGNWRAGREPAENDVARIPPGMGEIWTDGNAKHIFQLILVASPGAKKTVLRPNPSLPAASLAITADDRVLVGEGNTVLANKGDAKDPKGGDVKFTAKSIEQNGTVLAGAGAVGGAVGVGLGGDVTFTAGSGIENRGTVTAGVGADEPLATGGNVKFEVDCGRIWNVGTVAAGAGAPGFPGPPGGGPGGPGRDGGKLEFLVHRNPPDTEPHRAAVDNAGGTVQGGQGGTGGRGRNGGNGGTAKITVEAGLRRVANSGVFSGGDGGAAGAGGGAAPGGNGGHCGICSKLGNKRGVTSNCGTLRGGNGGLGQPQPLGVQGNGGHLDIADTSVERAAKGATATGGLGAVAGRVVVEAKDRVGLGLPIPLAGAGGLIAGSTVTLCVGPGGTVDLSGLETDAIQANAEVYVYAKGPYGELNLQGLQAGAIWAGSRVCIDAGPCGTIDLRGVTGYAIMAGSGSELGAIQIRGHVQLDPDVSLADITYPAAEEITTDCRPDGFVGDMNCDGVVDFGDIDVFVAALTNADIYMAAYPECDWRYGDCNCDGLLDFDDLTPFAALLNGSP